MLPQKIARYDILAELGRGGMAIVYKAYDPLFEREVALKALPSESLEDPHFRTRFVREAKTIASLEHPAVVPVYDFGEDGDRLFLVMRLMPGGSLAQKVKHGALSPSEAYRIVGRIAPALDMAHEKGIIHRDLKPDNILFDQYGEAYLSDFGIARLAASQATLTGKFAIGTPGYMSPEQIQGQELDGRSDLYALGVILFEMLTGKRPFVADTPAMILVKQMTASIPLLSETRPDTSAALDAVVHQAMAQERESRPTSAQEIVSLLHQAMDGQQANTPTPTPAISTTSGASAQASPPEVAPTPASDQSSSEDLASDPTMVVETPEPMTPIGSANKLAKSGGSTRWVIGIVALLAVLGIGYFVLSGQQDSEPIGGDPTAIAVQERTAAEQETLEAEESGGETAVSNPAPTSASSVEATDHTIEEHLAQAQILLDEGSLYGAIEEATEALAHDDNNAYAYRIRGFAHTRVGSYDLAFADLTRAIELDPNEPAPYVELGFLEINQRTDYETGISHFSQAIALEDNNEWARAGRCEAYGRAGRSEEARPDCERCLEINNENSSCLLSQGYVLRDLQEYEQAAAVWEQLLPLSPSDGYLRQELAQLYLWNLENSEQALIYANEAIELNDQEPYFYHIRGNAHVARQNTEEAIADFEKMLALADEHFCHDCRDRGRRYLENNRPPSPDYLSNFAALAGARASNHIEGYEPQNAVDGNVFSEWYSQQMAPQWIELNLQEERTITALELRINQEPTEGETTHVIWGAGADGNFVELHIISEFTKAGQWLYFEPDEPWTNLQFIRIETTESPSEVAWYEIRTLGYGN
ncbi:MAG: protein kinase [Chloroflexota bacterium]